MTEDVKPECIKKTQDILGKYIKKPILTEKLLRKPPFRFLFDIFTSAMKETGFLEEVLNKPEDKIENIKDKEGKIAFLQKVIAAVEAANGIKLSVKPNKVVAGLEATKTNEFLQALGKALDKQQQENKSSKASELSKTKNNKKPKDESLDKKKTTSKNSKKVIENGVHEPRNEHRNKPDSNHTQKRGKNSDEKPKEKDINNMIVKKTFSNKNEEKDKNEKQDTDGSGESTLHPDIDNITLNGANGQGDHNFQGKEEIAREEELKRGSSGKHKHRRPSLYNVGDQVKVGEDLENNEKKVSPSKKTEALGIKIMNEKPYSSNKSENILKEHNGITPSSPEQLNSSKIDSNFVKEGPLISRPRTGIRPTTARPASARPAAPRIRDRSEAPVLEEIIKPASGKVQVIVDKDQNVEPEDENLISLETTNDILLEEPALISSPKTIKETNEQGEHGHLVEQILEVQRELEDDSQLKLSEEKTTGKTDIEWESGRSKESAYREIEKLRSSIQTLTRSANPLGKLLDFFQEDIDIVHKELESWKEKNSSLCVQIAHERSITEQFVEPLKIHLKELQQSVDEQLEQISVVKANIIRNNQKIQKLLAGM